MPTDTGEVRPRRLRPRRLWRRGPVHRAAAPADFAGCRALGRVQPAILRKPLASLYAAVARLDLHRLVRGRVRVRVRARVRVSYPEPEPEPENVPEPEREPEPGIASGFGLRAWV